ncbi:hypothetical protein P8452_32674 [Trifolium repens]|nr:hypothetical protein P8452_32674 [Trifolium repens]
MAGIHRVHQFLLHQIWKKMLVEGDTGKSYLAYTFRTRYCEESYAFPCQWKKDHKCPKTGSECVVVLG